MYVKEREREVRVCGCSCVGVCVCVSVFLICFVVIKSLEKIDRDEVVTVLSKSFLQQNKENKCVGGGEA